MGRNKRACSRSRSPTRMEDLPWENIFARLDSTDRSAVSEVCQEWKRMDSLYRREVSINSFSSIAPSAVTRRFHHLHSVGIRGDLALCAPNHDSHSHFRPWMGELGRAYRQTMKKILIRSMAVTDADLEKMAEAFSDSLVTLKLKGCSGNFSSKGLYQIISRCRQLKVLNLKYSEVEVPECADQWLNKLAVTSYALEELNINCFNSSSNEGKPLGVIWNIHDLQTLVSNCKSLRSLKVSDDVTFNDMRPFLRRATALTRLRTGSCTNAEQGNQSPLMTVNFPTSIVALSGFKDLTSIFSICQRGVLARLKSLKFDSRFPIRTEQGFIDILQHCVGLERLMTKSYLGDGGLITVSKTCKDLKTIRILGSDGQQISPRGIIPLLQGCKKLEHLFMQVTDITNATLTAVANNCIFMRDCHFDMYRGKKRDDVPLDGGVKDLLIGCQYLYAFCLNVPEGCLTDMGMAYIGLYGSKLKKLGLRCTGGSADGLRFLANGCRSLQELRLSFCLVCENELASMAMNMRTLKCIRANGLHVLNGGGQILAQSQSNWIVASYKGDWHVMIAHRSFKDTLVLL